LISIYKEKIMNTKWIANAAKFAAGIIIAYWMKLEPLMQLLLILMLADILTGLVRAFMQKEISSDISWQGIGKKAIVLVIVAAAEYTGQLAEIQLTENLSLGAMVAGFYAVNEFISILENASAAGIPVPEFLQDALQKINPEKFEKG